MNPPAGGATIRAVMARTTDLPTIPPTRRFTDAVERPATVIGPGISIRGELSGDDPVDLGGRLEGDSRVTGHFTVREGAAVTGRVEATTIVVRGEVMGPALKADKIEIGPSAHVVASLRARVVAIAEGAYFDGQVQMEGEGAAPITFKERRSPRPGEDTAGG